jgi:hypothetical protein
MHEAAVVNRRNGAPAVLVGRDRGPDAARQCWSSTELPGPNELAEDRDGRGPATPPSWHWIDHDPKGTQWTYSPSTVGPLSAQDRPFWRLRVRC